MIGLSNTVGRRHHAGVKRGSSEAPQQVSRDCWRQAPTGVAARGGGAHRLDAGTCAPRQISRAHLTTNLALPGDLGRKCCL